MLNHKALVASLTPEQRASLTATSDAHGLAHLGLHAAAIVALAAAISAGVTGWPFLLVPLGVLLVFLFTVMHEATHRTAFRTPWVNTAVAGGTGFLLVIPPEWFRYFHFAHHRHTQDPAHDPELATPKPETRLAYAWHVSGLPLWWSSVCNVVRNAAGRNADAFVPEKGRAKVATEARAMLAGYAVLAAVSWWAGSDLLLWIWIVPVLLGQPFLRLYLLAEHGRCPFVANMLENSRTTLTNRLVKAIAWNMPYHAEHHAYPAVPFHRLPAFHELARAHLKETERGYARFNARYVAALDR